jgi:hypothetical protein
MKNVIYGFVLLTLLMACNKSDTSTTTDPLPTAPQTANYTYPSDEVTAVAFLSGDDKKTWRANRFNLSMIGSQQCRLDDKMVLFKNGTYDYDNGADFCGGDINRQSGTWTLSFETKELIFDEGTAKEETANIVDLTATSLQVTGSWSIYQIGAGYTFK